MKLLDEARSFAERIVSLIYAAAFGSSLRRSMAKMGTMDATSFALDRIWQAPRESIPGGFRIRKVWKRLQFVQAISPVIAKQFRPELNADNS